MPLVPAVRVGPHPARSSISHAARCRACRGECGACRTFIACSPPLGFLPPRGRRERYFPAVTTTTFFARVLNRSPSACTTVIETYPVLPVLMSRTVPPLPSCVPPMTLHRAPSTSLPGCFLLIWFVPSPACTSGRRKSTAASRERICPVERDEGPSGID